MPILQNDTTPSQQVTEGLERKLIHLDNLMVVVCEFTNGPMKQPDPPHSHPHEQITFVARGEVNVFIDGVFTQLKEGDMFAVPGNVPHCIQTLSEYVKLVDSFNPIRKEFIDSK